VLLLDDGHCLRTQALELCARVGADEAAVRATSLSTLAQMVAGGAGVTLLPALAVPVENRAGGLVVRPFGRDGPSRELVLVFRASSPLTEALRGVAAVLREAFDAAVARPKGR
jgi:LysR family hydrogen peroxide-inducible transcriptional activator